MEKILIYPYNKSYEPVVAHQKLIASSIANIQIESLVSPRGWGLEDDIVDGSYGVIKVSCDFEAELDKCTMVWFVEDGNLQLPEDILFDKLHKAIRANKKIIYTRTKNYSQYKQAMTLIPNDIKVNINIHKNSNLLNKAMCYKINVPVLIVFGLEENTDKFEVQLGLREEFISRGYKVSSISSRRDSDILCVHSMPEFMFKNEISEADKIIQYNHYVKEVELDENPEIIIIGIPGGIVPFDSFNHNNYGIMAFEISNAVPCDCAVMCSPYYQFFNGDYSEVHKDMFNKYGFNVEYIHIAPITIDTRTIADNFIRGFLTIKKDFVKNKVRDYNRDDVLYLGDKSGLEIAVDGIINKLNSYC
jgi:peptide maturation system protein (TIGR04066 family)